jgi:NADH-quinone oxidoreductase subunit F
VNNIETLLHALAIVADGPAAFRAAGSDEAPGTRLFAVSGSVTRPGVYELGAGARLGQLLALAGGVRPGQTLKAVLLGGAAGSFVGADALDLVLTPSAVRAAGATLGSGAVVFFDDGVDMGDIVLRIARFFRDESCGQCVPCRIGTVRQEEMVARLLGGRPQGSLADEAARFGDLAAAMRDASICGLGQTAPSAIESALRLGIFAGGEAQA